MRNRAIRRITDASRAVVGTGCGFAGLALLVGCALAVEPGKQPPVVAADAAPERSSGSPVSPTRSSCEGLIADAPAAAQRRLGALCQATSFDGSCVGNGCTRPAAREAVECLLEDDQVAPIVALTDAAEPAVRAYAREVLTRTGRWTLAEIATALADDAVISGCDGCNCDRIVLARAGVRAALDYDDRGAVEPLLRAWAMELAAAATADSAGEAQLNEWFESLADPLVEALRARGDERWVDVATLSTWRDDTAAPSILRAAAALTLARRSVASSSEQLYAWARGDDPRVAVLAVHTLDRLGIDKAWEDLAALRARHVHSDIRDAMLRLGARHRTDAVLGDVDVSLDLVPLDVILALPAGLRRARWEAALCANIELGGGWVGLDRFLWGLSPSQRCDVLQATGTACAQAANTTAWAAAVAPSFARACGLVPADTLLPAADCWATRDKLFEAQQAQERDHALELERRARAAAALNANGAPETEAPNRTSND